MSAETTKIALLKTWQEKGYDYPVYGIVDTNDFYGYVTATMTFGDGRGLEVKREDVAIVENVSWEEVFPWCK